MVTARETYAMLNNQTLWNVAGLCERLLSDAGVAHAVCGGVAVCLHGYQRNTVDLDLVVRAADSGRIRETLTAADMTWFPETKEFRTDSGIAIHFLTAGDKAGDGGVRVPEPEGEEFVEQIEGLTVVRLSRLIEMKLAAGEASLRRTHKDFADVVELIVVRNLDSSFARFLHTSLRKTFRELVRHARDETR